MPIKPSKLSGKNAQHTLEYMILLMLIMAGIIIGGPYAIRSWNAQMKGWEDSVLDSMNDPLTQAAVGTVSIPGCDFLSWQNTGCGLGYSLLSNSLSCNPQQMLQLGVFTPTDCQLNNPYVDFNQVAQCQTDDSNHCCTPWVTPSGCAPGDFGCPADSDCGVTVGCPDGEYRQTRTCDTGYSETECDDTYPGCVFACGGPLTAFVDESTAPPTLSNATFCAGDNSGLPGDRDYVVVNNCTAGTKCEFACNTAQGLIAQGCDGSGNNCTYCACLPGLTLTNVVRVYTNTVPDTAPVGFEGRWISTYDDFRGQSGGTVYGSLSEVCKLALGSTYTPVSTTPVRNTHYACLVTTIQRYRHNGTWYQSSIFFGNVSPSGQGHCEGLNEAMYWVDCITSTTPTCQCAPGYVQQTFCSSGYCNQGSCSAGYCQR